MPTEFPILSRQQVRVERLHGASLNDLLRRLYLDEGLTYPQIAERLDVSVSTVNRWMKAAAITTRTRGTGSAVA